MKTRILTWSLLSITMLTLVGAAPSALACSWEGFAHARCTIENATGGDPNAGIACAVKLVNSPLVPYATCTVLGP